ncbi:hypothetical protein MUP00_00635 [Candidatus Bathyarchaeota archaeon]|nr:hypothetical protein [Candidatus Bathyarchaeota archaeon]
MRDRVSSSISSTRIPFGSFSCLIAFAVLWFKPDIPYRPDQFVCAPSVDADRLHKAFGAEVLHAAPERPLSLARAGVLSVQVEELATGEASLFLKEARAMRFRGTSIRE